MNSKVSEEKPVLVIYTGGTIGCVPSMDGGSLAPVPWEQLVTYVKKLENYAVLPQPIAEPVDSSNVTYENWVEIVRIIKMHWDECCGIVILHGTDTMAYTATALSFMLRNLSKPVIVTGSQLPIAYDRNDAEQNLITSLQIARGFSDTGEHIPRVPEVCLFFRDNLYRGCRSTKISASEYDGFDSPNYPPLAKAGEHIEVNTDRLRAIPSGIFSISTAINPGVITTRLSPGMAPSVLPAIASLDSVQGIVLETYGTGNAPTTEEFLKAVGEVRAKGKFVVNVSQCVSGQVEMGLYETSVGLIARDVISGLDLTTEAALIKLQVLLAEYGDDHDEVYSQMLINAVGEQSRSIHTARFSDGATDNGSFRSPLRAIAGDFQGKTVEKATLRLFSVRASNSTVEGRVYLNLPSSQSLEPALSSGSESKFVGRIVAKTSERDSLSLDITSAVEAGIVRSGKKVSFSVFSGDDTDIQWGRAELGIVCDERPNRRLQISS